MTAPKKCGCKEFFQCLGVFLLICFCVIGFVLSAAYITQSMAEFSSKIDKIDGIDRREDRLMERIQELQMRAEYMDQNLTTNDNALEKHDKRLKKIEDLLAIKPEEEPKKEIIFHVQ